MFDKGMKENPKKTLDVFFKNLIQFKKECFLENVLLIMLPLFVDIIFILIIILYK